MYPQVCIRFRSSASNACRRERWEITRGHHQAVSATREHCRSALRWCKSCHRDRGGALRFEAFKGLARARAACYWSVHPLNSGLGKHSVPEEGAAGLHGFATAGHPELRSLDPPTFVKLLSGTEIGLGAALLAPVVPSWLAGAGLTAFSLGLMRLYLNGPGMRREGSLPPTGQGISLAKDSWMLSIGVALLVDSITDR
jgi:hypothetical protein